MSRTETLELASTPFDEPCAQVGTEGYGLRARRESLIYLAQLRRHAAAAGKEIPESVRLFVKANNGHDYGTYYEAAVRFPEDDEAAADVAFWLENNQPANWDEEAKAALAEAEERSRQIPADGIFGDGG